MRDSVIVSSGDVTVKWARNCLIIAQGTIQCENDDGGGFLNCRLVSGGRVLVPERLRLRVSNCVVEENATMPLGFVRFFDPAREGVVVEAAKGGVRVKAVDAAKPFAKAGLRVGDLLTAVQGAAVDSPETFCRLLRRAWVGDEDCTLAVVRSGKALDVRVPIPQ
jgi:S1-C subfamily serine protease